MVTTSHTGRSFGFHDGACLALSPRLQPDFASEPRSRLDPGHAFIQNRALVPGHTFLQNRALAGARPHVASEPRSRLGCAVLVCSAMLCYPMLCYATPWYAMMRYAMLCQRLSFQNGWPKNRGGKSSFQAPLVPCYFLHDRMQHCFFEPSWDNLGCLGAILGPFWAILVSKPALTLDFSEWSKTRRVPKSRVRAVLHLQASPKEPS